MSELVEKIDDLGLPAWIAVMVLGFVVFWPVGLAVLAYLIWSGRMGCGRNSSWGSTRWERKMQKFQDKMDRWQQRGQARAGGFERAYSHGSGFATSGNRAFDDYRDATMKRLEEEFGEFKSFLDRLREAKDKAEFDQFMNDRRNRPAGEQGPTQGGTSGGPINPGSAPRFMP